MTEFHDADSIGTDSNTHVLPSGPEIYSHEHQEVDRRQLLCIDGLTAYEAFLECQSDGCSEEASLIFAEGDFPDSPEEVDDLMYDVYRWFRENAVDLVPYKKDASLYIATYVLIAGEEHNHSLLRSRIALFLAADKGYQDGDHSRLPKKKGELLRTVKQQTRDAIQALGAGQNPALNQLYREMEG
ncbi:hypothetical protein [Halostella sp. PRR32]|uniref:hypothetical protein n=1 Tax=Halostella sp. PRR32 TaxID=3098147 RepID=UPI002B1DFBCD|nr:hypothetical protein [Halostella sp. PRR32]